MNVFGISNPGLSGLKFGKGGLFYWINSLFKNSKCLDHLAYTQTSIFSWKHMLHVVNVLFKMNGLEGCSWGIDVQWALIIKSWCFTKIKMHFEGICVRVINMQTPAQTNLESVQTNLESVCPSICLSCLVLFIILSVKGELFLKGNLYR